MLQLFNPLMLHGLAWKIAFDRVHSCLALTILERRENNNLFCLLFKLDDISSLTHMFLFSTLLLLFQFIFLLSGLAKR